MSRLLIALSIVQTLAVGFLAARVIEMDQRLQHTEATAARALMAEAGTPAIAAPQTQFAAVAAQKTAGVDPEILRRIIREEMAIALRGAGAAPGAGVATAETQSAPDPRVVASTRSQFNRLVAKRVVATKDLDLYLDQIAELPPAERKKALSELTMAMNDGRISGHF